MCKASAHTAWDQLIHLVRPVCWCCSKWARLPVHSSSTSPAPVSTFPHSTATALYLQMLASRKTMQICYVKLFFLSLEQQKSVYAFKRNRLTCERIWGGGVNTVAAIPTLAAGDLIIRLPNGGAWGGGGFHLLKFSLQYSAHGLPHLNLKSRDSKGVCVLFNN